MMASTSVRGTGLRPGFLRGVICWELEIALGCVAKPTFLALIPEHKVFTKKYVEQSERAFPWMGRGKARENR